MNCTLATRGSALARVQAETARAALAGARPDLQFDLLVLETRGDRLQDVSLEAEEGRGFFTEDLEAALSSGQASLAVHSLKDLPVDPDPDLAVVATLAREDPRDVIVSPHGGLDDLPEGTLVGTDSHRRRAQIALRRPDLRFAPVRGNVPTRLSKLDRGEYGALVLAAAGLVRLGLSERAGHPLEPDVCLPAPGQGAIALQAAIHGSWAGVAGAVDDEYTRAATTAERSFLAALGGGCQAPVGALAEVARGVLHLRGVLVSNGVATRAEIEGPASEAERLGREAATGLLAAGV